MANAVVPPKSQLEIELGYIFSILNDGNSDVRHNGRKLLKLRLDSLDQQDSLVITNVLTATNDSLKDRGTVNPAAYMEIMNWLLEINKKPQGNEKEIQVMRLYQ